MEPAEWRPILAALALPPAAPLLLAGLGFVLGLRRRVLGGVLVAVGLAALWLLSCNAVAIQLSHRLLRQVAPLPSATVVEHLKFQQVQAIVVLGPEPLIGPQQVILSHQQRPDQALRVVTDGLRPFTVESMP